MHRKLVKEVIHSGKSADMECLETMMIEMIDDLKVKDHQEYKNIEHKLYKMVYGDHLNEELAHKWVDSMVNKDETHGAHWGIEETSKHMRNHHKYDWYAVLNMMYSDYYNPKFDTETYIELANDWFNDKDSHPGKTLKYYFDLIKYDK